MARKYDRYGYNRQYKAKPCTKRYPFPYPLPFVDDFSAANVLEKAAAAPDTADPDTAFGGGQKRKRTRSEIEEAQAKRRKTNAARKLQYPDPLGANVYKWNRSDTKMALLAAAAPLAPLAAPLLFESGAITNFVRYRTRRQALRDARAILKAMESKPKAPRQIPGKGLIKAFKKMNRKMRKANTIMNFIDRFPIRH